MKTIHDVNKDKPTNWWTSSNCEVHKYHEGGRADGCRDPVLLIFHDTRH